MKFFIVLLAIVAAVSAGYYEIGQPLVAPVVHHSPVVHAAPVVHALHQPYVAPASKYIKVAAPVAHAHKKYYDAAYIPQQPAIPPPHPGPLRIKGDEKTTRIHYDAPKVPYPHLVGEEHYAPAPEPAITVVKKGYY